MSLRVCVLALTALSIAVSLAIAGCAGHVLHTFSTQQTTNPWWLPIWPQHFDSRGLRTLVGACASVLALNVLSTVSTFLLSKKPATGAQLATIICAVLSSIAAFVSVVYPAVLDSQSPSRDTMQTWTCRWSSETAQLGAPANFGALCRENRFAYFASIPLFVFQISLLFLAVWSLVQKRRVPDYVDEKPRGQADFEMPSFDEYATGGDNKTTAQTSARIVNV